MDENEDHPGWWSENENLRDSLALPSYEPPRFLDGEYTHDVVAPLEAKYDCTIRFLGENVQYGDEWEVQVDSTTVLTLGRTRDSNGNTVFKLSSEEFRHTLEEQLQSQ